MRSALRGLAFTTAAITALLGCGGDEQSAEDKCETLVNTFCESVTSCAEEADLFGEDYSANDLLMDCKQTVAKGAHCGDAKEVTAKYDSCLTAASDKLACDDSNTSLLEEETFAIPAVCEGVIRY